MRPKIPAQRLVYGSVFHGLVRRCGRLQVDAKLENSDRAVGYAIPAQKHVSFRAYRRELRVICYSEWKKALWLLGL